MGIRRAYSRRRPQVRRVGALRCVWIKFARSGSCLRASPHVYKSKVNGQIQSFISLRCSKGGGVSFIHYSGLVKMMRVLSKCQTIQPNKKLLTQDVYLGRSGGRVVKLLALGLQSTRTGVRFLTTFQRLLSPASKSRYGWNTAKAT